MRKPTLSPSPWPDYRVGKIERRLVGVLRSGLARAGIETSPPHHSVITLKTKPAIGVFIDTYTIDPRWWRITLGVKVMVGDFPEVADPKELTLHLDEFTERIGVDLARLLREPGWRWPLFAHWNSYPRYAWSELAHSTHRAHSRFLEAHDVQRKQCVTERRVAR
jgi:hypothetical protein